MASQIRARVTIFQHFGTTMLEQNPDALAQDLEDELKLRVIAAHDGMCIDLSTEIGAVHA